MALPHFLGSFPFDGDYGYGDGDYDGDDGECLKNLSRRLSQFAM